MRTAVAIAIPAAATIDRVALSRTRSGCIGGCFDGWVTHESRGEGGLAGAQSAAVGFAALRESREMRSSLWVFQKVALWENAAMAP